MHLETTNTTSHSTPADGSSVPTWGMAKRTSILLECAFFLWKLFSGVENYLLVSTRLLCLLSSYHPRGQCLLPSKSLHISSCCLGKGRSLQSAAGLPPYTVWTRESASILFNAFCVSCPQLPHTCFAKNRGYGWGSGGNAVITVLLFFCNDKSKLWP